MNVYVTKIQVNKVFHLENFDIELGPNEKKHLILTGENGSGKTVLLNNLADFLLRIKIDTNLTFLAPQKELDSLEQELKELIAQQESKMVDNEDEIHFKESRIQYAKDQINDIYGKASVEFNDIYELARKLKCQDFILCHYPATRRIQVTAPSNPEKPNLEPVLNVKDSKSKEFLKFLVNLKVQESLARNEGQDAAADEIKNWFLSFAFVLQKLFGSEEVSLGFNYRDYSFTINQKGRKFGFKELSDGYAAIFEILADLIIKMQTPDKLTCNYEKEGVVLIDEVDVHLHLKLQSSILPLLTQFFPNIQFIVTTNSPFVVNFVKNAIAFDLGKLARIENLVE